jgi:hypothetical protein
MVPCYYNEDRFDDPGKAVDQDAWERTTPSEALRSPDEIEELIRRGEDRAERHYECNDTTPINYTNGPHERELDVDDKDDLQSLRHDFGRVAEFDADDVNDDDDEQLEPADPDEDEFDD